MTRKNGILAMVLLSVPAGAAPHPPPPDGAAPKALLELRGRLLSSERDQVKADFGRFRALCDADGYPLVGNVANKGGRFQPSELCAEVRRAEKK
jgi:hypothetical protein